MLLPLLFAVIPGIAIGWLVGGRLSQLGRLRIQGLWLIVVGLAIQVVAMGYVGRSWGAVLTYRPAIILGTYLLVLVGLLRNVRLPGMQIIALGFVLNFLVIAANGGGMPVSYSTLAASGQAYLVNGQQTGQYVAQSKDVLLPKDQTRLWVLSDVFLTPPPLTRAASLGDFLTYAGVAVVIAFAMRRPAGETEAGVIEEVAAGA